MYTYTESDPKQEFTLKEDSTFNEKALNVSVFLYITSSCNEVLIKGDTNIGNRILKYTDSNDKNKTKVNITVEGNIEIQNSVEISNGKLIVKKSVNDTSKIKFTNGEVLIEGDVGKNCIIEIAGSGTVLINGNVGENTTIRVTTGLIRVFGKCHPTAKLTASKLEKLEGQQPAANSNSAPALSDQLRSYPQTSNNNSNAYVGKSNLPSALFEYLQERMKLPYQEALNSIPMELLSSHQELLCCPLNPMNNIGGPNQLPYTLMASPVRLFGVVYDFQNLVACPADNQGTRKLPDGRTFNLSQAEPAKNYATMIDNLVSQYAAKKSAVIAKMK
jgi:formylmethanofuran dehydrogenase subunit C